MRQLLGYERMGGAELVEPINELYRLWGRLHNWFCPTFKLKEKKRDGAKIRKLYERPETPLQRLMRSAEVEEKTKRLMKEEMRELDPFELKAQIEAQLRRVFALQRRLEEGKESTFPVSSQQQPIQVPLGNILQ